MARKQGEDPGVELVKKSRAECKTYRDTLNQEVERLYRAYRGQIEKRSEAAAWTSKYHPPYILQMIESMVAAISDTRPKVRIDPRPKDGDDLVAALHGAKTLEHVVNYYLDRDKWAEKQRAWILQALICKLTVAKVYWHEQKGYQNALQYRSELVYDGGMPLSTVPKLVETQSYGQIYNGPCIEVRDVRDFWWPEGAVDVQTAEWVLDDVYMPVPAAKALASEYGVNLESLAAEDWMGTDTEREAWLGNRTRNKNLCRVTERWTNDGVVTVLNDKILLRDSSKENPYWHGQKPYVVTSAMPEPFQFAGISVVEIVDHLQEMLWSLQNQRLDGLKLISNPIWLMRADLADIDAFEWAPGALWPVEDINQTKPLEINPTLANMTLDAEALIKGDLQNIPGGALFAGADSQTIDQKTATGVSIVSSIAQKLVQARQQQFRYGQVRIVEQTGSNCQQFLRQPELIKIAGQGADPQFLRVDPEEIQGRYDYIAQFGDESVVRQEKRAEYISLMQALIAGAPVFAQAGVQINWNEFLSDMMEQGWDISNAQQYIQPFQLPGAASGATPPPNQPGNGVTSPLAVSPTSPSNDLSLNPATAMARMGALNGGPMNAG